MPRGGYRENAGSKPKWIHGETKVIRVPSALADQILAIARILDEGKSLDSVTGSKTIDLSGIPVQTTSNGLAVYIYDLLKVGYKVRPIALADKVRKDGDKGIKPK